MTQEKLGEQAFFCRCLESFHRKLTLLMKVFLTNERSLEHPKQAIQVFKCGALLSHLSEYVADSSEGQALLGRLYQMVSTTPLEKEEGILHEQELFLARFLLAYAHTNTSVLEDVKSKMEALIQGDGDLMGIRVVPVSPSHRDSRRPRYPDYDYLMLLVESFVFFNDDRAYRRLERYCVESLHEQSYHDICCRHRLLGFYSFLSGSFQSIAKDILLQNLYRTRFRHTALKNDPWRFVEQFFLYQLACPDLMVFRFVTPLLRKLVEDHSHLNRYADHFSDAALDGTYGIASSLYWYRKINEHYSDLEATAHTEVGKSIWDTSSVLRAVDGELVPQRAASMSYTMGTFVVSQVIPGALFFLPDHNWKKEYRLDNDKVLRAFSSGAAAIVTSNAPALEHICNNQQFIAVRNTFTAMLRLALENRARYQGMVIGITGSVGKTTTATMLYDILSSFAPSYKNISLFNHETGTPKSVANIPQDSAYAIIEMGMGQPGTILPKTVLARPHVVLITEIQHDHMEFHDSINSVIETKMEIVDGLEPGGTVVLNRDSRYYAYMLGVLQEKGPFRMLTFGEHPLSDIRAVSLQLSAKSSEIEIEVNNLKYCYTLSLPGVHMALNSLAACAVLHALDKDLQEVLPHFQLLRPASGRNEILNVCLDHKRTIQVIDDSFNANPASMRSSFHILSLLNPRDGGRRIMVVGDMGELGKKTREYHEALAEDINQSKIDIFYSIGEYCGYLNGKLNENINHQHFSSMRQLRQAVLNTLHDGDIISFKGSARAGDMKKIIDSLKPLQPV